MKLGGWASLGDGLTMVLNLAGANTNWFDTNAVRWRRRHLRPSDAEQLDPPKHLMTRPAPGMCSVGAGCLQ
jgi:hypothetical protein